MRIITLVCFGIVGATAGWAVADSAKAAPGDELFRCLKPKGQLHIEFKPELGLEELVAWASTFSCESIVYSSGVAGRRLSVNIIAPKRMSARKAWALFHIALRSMNLALVARSGVYVVVEAPTGKGEALPLAVKRGGHGLVRSLVSAEFLSGAELVSVLGALKSKAGEVISLAGTEMVLVTDYADHVSKMRELLAEVDRSTLR